MMRLRLALAAVLIWFSAVQYAHGDGITNGRFETGDFSGWTVRGTTSFFGSALVYHTITGTGFGLAPIQGTSALMVARAAHPLWASCDDSVTVPSPGTLPLLLLGIGLAGLTRSRGCKRG